MARANTVDVSQLRAVDSVEILVLADNFTDFTATASRHVERMDAHIVRAQSSLHRHGDIPTALRAEHGFGSIVTVRVDSEVHRIVFDTGSTPEGFRFNSDALGVSLNDVDGIVLSHGHFDHTGGMEGVLSATRRNPLPIYAHPHIWRRRKHASVRWGGFEHAVLDRDRLARHNVEFIENTDPRLIADATLLLTGEVPRVTPFERGFTDQEALIEGEWRGDPETWDDQALVILVRNEGLVVVTGCGHSGIVNILNYAEELQPGVRIAAVAGGFHLNGVAVDDVLTPVVEGFVSRAPDVIMSCHCTGHVAFAALTHALPGRVVAGTVGSRLTLGPIAAAPDIIY